MKNRNLLFLLISNGLLWIIIVIGLLYFYKQTTSQQEIVYVDNIQLFNGFNMSKDLGKLNKKKIDKQKKKLDSLYAIYTILKEQNSTDKIQELESKLRLEDQELRKMDEYFSKEVSQQVWNRLNQYIKEYGESKEYTIILGTQGNGNVMFAQDGIDITDLILEYSNKKYEGN